jgi:hypothetical protein
MPIPITPWSNNSIVGNVNNASGLPDNWYKMDAATASTLTNYSNGVTNIPTIQTNVDGLWDFGNDGLNSIESDTTSPFRCTYQSHIQNNLPVLSNHNANSSADVSSYRWNAQLVSSGICFIIITQVFKPASFTGSVLVFLNNYNDAGHNDHYAFEHNLNGIAVMRQDRNLNYLSNLAVTNATASTPYITYYNNGSMWVNGVTASVAFNTNAGTYSNFSQIDMGSPTTGSASQYFMELMLWERTLTPVELNSNVNYLKTKWNINF